MNKQKYMHTLKKAPVFAVCLIATLGSSMTATGLFDPWHVRLWFK